MPLKTAGTTTRSTRSRLRSASHSSLSQSLSRAAPQVYPCTSTVNDDIAKTDGRFLPTKRARIKAPQKEDVQDDAEPIRLNDETQDTDASLAPLPVQYSISIALPPGHSLLDPVEAASVYTKGAELLSDGWRRSQDKEGLLDDLREEARQRRKLVRPTSVEHCPRGGEESVAKQVDGGELDLGTLWYTASYRHPVIGDLPIYPKAWCPRFPPPLSSDLPILPPQAGHLVPLVGSSIPPWNTSPTTDIEPHADDLEHFQHRWQEATGQGWSSIRIGAIDRAGIEVWSLDCDDVDARTEIDDDSSATDLNPALQTHSGKRARDVSRRPLKEKERALSAFLPSSMSITPAQSVNIDLTGNVEVESIESHPMFTLQPRTKAGGTSALEGPHAVPGVGIVVSDTAPPIVHERQASWESAAKQRKSWWRKEINQDPAYGAIWSILPFPHILNLDPSPILSSKKGKTPRPPDFILPRFYAKPTTPHPFHPDLSGLIATRPSGRVHWTIPINGPVHIPAYHDAKTSPVGKSPIPSSAYLCDELDPNPSSRPAGPSAKARPLVWTPLLLKHFWQSFLVPLHANPEMPFGRISIKVSGPKPDPHLSLRQPPPLPPWSTLQPTAISPDLDETSGRAYDAIPVRPEMGDHIRIYCNLRYALSLRTWLHGIEVSLASIVSAEERSPARGAGAEPDKGMYRPFHKVRLVLVGDRGEALVVA